MSGDMVFMHLPVTMFEAVLHVLRNEKPLFVRLIEGRGVIGFGNPEAAATATESAA